jgi:hypothetical protein
MSEDDDGVGGADGVGGKMMDTSEFAADMMGEPVAESHHEAEGIEGESEAGDLGSGERLKEMLLSSDPDQSLRETESPWNPEDGGVTRVYRGIKKMTGAPGMPAIGDLLIGLIEAVHSYQIEGGREAAEGGESADESQPPADVPEGADPITAQAQAED